VASAHVAVDRNRCRFASFCHVPPSRGGQPSLRHRQSDRRVEQEEEEEEEEEEVVVVVEEVEDEEEEEEEEQQHTCSTLSQFIAAMGGVKDERLGRCGDDTARTVG